MGLIPDDPGGIISELSGGVWEIDARMKLPVYPSDPASLPKKQAFPAPENPFLIPDPKL